jgi:hypothetical protein
MELVVEVDVLGDEVGLLLVEDDDCTSGEVLIVDDSDV